MKAIHREFIEWTKDYETSRESHSLIAHQSFIADAKNATLSFIEPIEPIETDEQSFPNGVCSANSLCSADKSSPTWPPEKSL